MSNRYPDMLANAFSSVKAWRTATFLLGGICAFLAASLAYTSLQAPAYLVPYEFATTTGKVKVAPGAANVNPDYLASIALGDLALITTFHPENVRVQFQRFLNRTTPALFAEQEMRLTAEAKEYADQKVSQTFYSNTTQVSRKGDRVEISGWLVRSAGNKEVLRSQVTYQLTYKESRGMLYVDGVSLKQ